MPRLILLHKPFNVLCQFSDDGGRATLKNYVPIGGVYPAGRLDRDSEGLVLLTDDGRWQARLSHPDYKQPKTYWVQVEGAVTAAALRGLEEGVLLDGRPTCPAIARPMAAPDLPERDPPIRQRRHIPTSWLSLILSEGRNRQVRRMTAAVGFPTLRLIRTGIGPLSLAGLTAGQYRELSIAEWKSLEKQLFGTHAARQDQGLMPHGQGYTQRIPRHARNAPGRSDRSGAQPSAQQRVHRRAPKRG